MSDTTNIIKRHFEALLAELQAKGIDASGIAGGVTEGAGPERTVYVVVLALPDNIGKERKRRVKTVIEALRLHIEEP
jgi:hypothetical protein